MLLLCLCSPFTQAQRVSVGIGLTGGGAQVLSTLRLIRVGTINSNAVAIDTLERPGSLAPFLGLQVPIYARLFQLSPDRSIGLAMSPMFGFYIPAQSIPGPLGVKRANVDTYGGTVILHMPVMLHFSQGMFSTAETDKEQGWGVGLGIEGTWMNDGWNREARNDPFFGATYILAPSLAIRPVGAIHWRYWSKRDIPVEWSLQFSTTQQTYELGTVSRPMVRLSHSLYFNY